MAAAPPLLHLPFLLILMSAFTQEAWSINCTNLTEYRQVNGRCNNLAKPEMGAGLTHFRRLLPPQYDNADDYVGFNDERPPGQKLPSPREVTNALVASPTFSTDITRSDLWTYWGQLLAHDLDLAPGMSIKCPTCNKTKDCAPIPVPANETRYKSECIKFVRSIKVADPSLKVDGSTPTKNQINAITHWLDGNIVYGSSEGDERALRDGDTAELVRGDVTPSGNFLLPPDTEGNMVCFRDYPTNRLPDCFMAGDVRTNEQVGLIALHTVWFREHNRLAEILAQLNPHWNAEKVYQETKKIVIAEWQHITYQEYLPLLIGTKAASELYTSYTGYKPDVDARIPNVFATAAFRLHVCVSPILYRLDENLEEVAGGHLALNETSWAPGRLKDEGGVDAVLRGLAFTPQKAVDVASLMSLSVGLSCPRVNMLSEKSTKCCE